MIKKTIYFLITSLFFTLVLIFLSLYFINSKNPEKVAFIKSLLPPELKFLIKEKVCLYGYYVPEYRNERIFPQTQFLKLNFNEITVNGLESRDSFFIDTKRNGQKVVPFYIETFADKNILISINGTTLFYDDSILFQNKSTKNYEINNNLPENITVVGSLLYEGKIFVSFMNRNKSCDSREIYVADINFDFLNFKEFYSHGSTLKCDAPIGVSGGVMAIYNDKGNPSIIISTYYPNNEEHPLLKDFNKEKETIMLLIDLKTKKSRPFTSGHRNPQGLLVTKENVIISTEHGPRGGDEVNKIIEGNNYGWPSRSYGEGGENGGDNEVFISNHSKYGFVEPIFAFLPSIAITQIIQVPEEFSPKWKNSYLIATLRNLSLYRVVFDENYSRIIAMEKIRIGKRIRDIVYKKKYNSFLLALENGSGSVGVINVD